MFHTSPHHSSLANNTAFGQFTRITIGVTEAIIRAQVVLPIAEDRYQKALVVQHFFRHTKQLTFLVRGLITTIISYFEF